MGEYSCLMLFCLTAVDTEMLFEVVFVFECFPTLQTFELPGLQALIQHDGALGRQDVVNGFMLEKIQGVKKCDCRFYKVIYYFCDGEAFSCFPPVSPCPAFDCDLPGAAPSVP